MKVERSTVDLVEKEVSVDYCDVCGVEEPMLPNDEEVHTLKANITTRGSNDVVEPGDVIETDSTFNIFHSQNSLDICTHCFKVYFKSEPKDFYSVGGLF